jgi:hypothetical protein
MTQRAFFGGFLIESTPQHPSAWGRIADTDAADFLP